MNSLTRAPRFTLERWVQGTAAPDLTWLARRHWRLIFLCGLAGLGLGVLYLRFFPDTYVSRAQVRFIPPQVNERYVTPNVAMQAEQRIFALTQILNSRLTATRMIESFGLYPELRMFYPIADLADKFQENLTLRQISSGDTTQNNRSIPSLSIAFRYSNPEAARKVVRRIMEQVYEENRRYRGDQSIGTTEFLQQQVTAVVEQMSDIESKISLLPPSRGEGNFRNMVEAEEMHDTERRLTDAKHQLRNVMTERELRDRTVKAYEAQLAAFDRQPPSTRPIVTNWEVNGLRARAAEARQRYAPGHPDRDAAEAALRRAEEDWARLDDRERSSQTRQSRDVLTAQLAKARAEFDGFDSSRHMLEREVAELSAKAERLRMQFKPAEVNDLDRLVLTREYAGLQEYYKDLLKKQRESQVASEMERRGQGETVELIEPPTLPGSAEAPNWIAKLGVGWAAGLAFGLGFVSLRFLVRPRLLSAEHLPAILDVPVVAELPSGALLSLPDPRQRSGQPMAMRTGARAWLSTAGLLLLLTGCAQEDVQALMKRAEAASKAGDEKSAILLYRKVLQTEPRHPEANLHLAEALLRNGQILPGRERLIRAVELLPNRADVAVRLAELSYQLYFADPGRPAPLLREIEDLAQRIIERSPNLPDGYRLRSQALLERRRSAEAITFLEPIAARFPGDGPLITQLATCYYQAGRKEEAESTLRRLAAAVPGYAQTYDILYLLLMETKRPDQARQALEWKAKRNPSMSAVLQLAAHDDALGQRPRIHQWLPKAAEAFNGDPQSFVQLGDFWLHRGEYNAARTAFLAGQSRHPAQRSTFAGRLVETHVAEKQPAEARRLLDAELRVRPSDPLLKAYQSALDLEAPSASARTRARAELESILTRLPNSPFVRFHLGRAYLRDGDFLRAGEQLERCVTLDPNYAPGWVALAEANFAAGQGAHAGYLVKATLDRAPSYAPALLLQARISLSGGRPADAETALKRLLTVDPHNRDARLALAQAKLMSGQALDADLMLSEMQVKDEPVILLQAEAKAAAGRPNDALSLLESTFGQNPANEKVRHALARMALRSGQSVKARDHYKILVQNKPNDLDLRLGYANSLGLSGETAQAADEYRKVQSNSGQDPRPWLNYAALMSSEGRVKEAREAYREAINRDKNNPYALNNLAYLMAKHREDLQTALNYAQQAKRSQPQSPAINDTLAYIYLLLGMTRNAAAVIEEVTPALEPAKQDLAQDFVRRLRSGDSAGVLSEIERGALQPARM